MVFTHMTGMSSATGGAAGSVGCRPGAADMERVRYFPRQLVTADDLTQEQLYVRAKLRRHNRLLHGWGVVCGAEVRPAPADWSVTITPGYLLGPEGAEILIDREVTVDLSRQGLDGNVLTACGEDIDPWCSNVRVDRRAGDTVFLAVAYAECPSRPVRVQPAGCSCEGSACEYSRIRDGFSVRALDRLPDSYADIMNPPVAPFACPATGVRECPECIEEPWVVLAAVTIRGRTIAARDIDNHTYRRYVASFAGWWFKCAPAAGNFVQPAQIRFRFPNELNPNLPPRPTPQPGSIAVGIVGRPLAGVIEPVDGADNALSVPAGTFEVSATNGFLVDASGAVATSLRIDCGTTGGADPNTCRGVNIAVTSRAAGTVQLRARYEPNAVAAAAGIEEREATAGVQFIAQGPTPTPIP